MLVKGPHMLPWIAAVALLTTGPSALAAPAKNAVATAALTDASGAVKGQARMTVKRARVELRITASGLPAGTHGIHLHAVGTCTAPDFASAGGHLNPAGKMHGTHNPQGSHLGDLPNLIVARNGRATLTTLLTGAPADLTRQLFDADGTALVVHAGPDDYMTDPSGNSGGRILCGVVTRG